MHVLSIKTGLKLAALLVLGILLMLSLSLLVYKSYKALTQGKTAPLTTTKAAPADRTNAEGVLALLLDPGTYPFVQNYQETQDSLKIKVTGQVWKQLSSKERNAYLLDLASIRSRLGRKPEVKILDEKTSLELSSYEHGRILLEENQGGS